jgi:hypothetical protein
MLLGKEEANTRGKAAALYPTSSKHTHVELAQRKVRLPETKLKLKTPRF